ncbi:MAG: carbonic anhydrase, partial [Deltaproteobacteria bacterium]|nr:carbonic anhydrase [Deltaproteobacteria bacterium]
LPAITDDYPLKDLNRDVVQVNIALAAGYKKEKISCNGQ